jgi:leucine dehydrogenase
VAPGEILSAPCEILAPCALGGTIDRETASRLGAAIVAGAANNQLETIEAGDILHDRGILYAPDFVINAGGLINIAVELEPAGYREERALELVDGIADTLRQIFSISEQEDVAPGRAALGLAEARVNGRA